MMTQAFRRSGPVLLWISLILGSSKLAAQHDYKVSRSLIRAGKHSEALEVLEKRIAKFPKDHEWVYQKAIALAQSNRLPDAMTHLQRSLAMGVPGGRVAADAHDLLKPLRDQKAFQQIVQPYTNQPIQGPMVGSVTNDSAQVWLRTASSAAIRIVVMGVNKQEQVQWSGQTTTDSDYTIIARLGPLAADTDYRYTLFVN